MTIADWIWTSIMPFRTVICFVCLFLVTSMRVGESVSSSKKK